MNKRVNYPVKAILCKLQENDDLPNDDTEWFIAAEFIRKVCEIGVARLVNAWNHHRIDNKGVPINGDREIGQVPDHELPCGEAAVRLYERGGGSITRPAAIYSITDSVLRECRDDHYKTLRTVEEIYEKALINDEAYFLNSLQLYISVTKTYLPCG